MLTERQVRARLAKRIERAGSMRKLAREWGLTAGYLSHVMRGRRRVGPRLQVLLGLTRQERFEVQGQGGKR